MAITNPPSILVIVALLATSWSAGAVAREQGPTATFELPPTSSSFSDLAKQYPIATRQIDLGEGFSEEGATLFPKDSNRTISIKWKNPKARRGIAAIYIRSRGWRIAPGFQLGQSLQELERMNGKPFRLTGFGWDYAGTILSWSDGRIPAQLSKKYKYFIRLGPPSTSKQPALVKHHQQVLGDREFSSGHPAMQALKPTVYEIVLQARTQPAAVP